MGNKNLLILGAGGHGRVVKETAEAMGCFDKIDFLDDNSEIAIGLCKEFKKYINDYKYAFPAFGNNELRMKWLQDLTNAGFELPVLIHPTAYVSPSAMIGEGSIVLAKTVINTSTVMEKGCILSIGALVDHDSHVGECSHINTGAIVKAGDTVDRLAKINAGVVYSGKKTLEKIFF
ncbi:MAG: hypothetical protein KGZ96_07730 [Clostridia bacterium]|jgi:UDP-N-acetylbacillosamine N-acetyltransferase|nr:hypothetical protein [Clostridia bacterium]